MASIRPLLAVIAVAASSCTQPNPGYQPELPDVGGPGQRDGEAGVRDLGGSQELALRHDQAVTPSRPVGVDLLIVVDNSPAMATPQKWLARDVAALILALEALPGGVNFRIGVVSTDVGVGSYSNQNCTANGDKGKLLVRAGCTGPTGGAKYLERIGTALNYVPPLAERLGCMVQLGESGCGFEQPLESMRLALDGANPDFLRPSAALAVLILSNEDDCSAANTSLFDSKSTTLGPYSSFRCFQYGVLCNGKQPPREPTLLSGCQPGQAYLHEVAPRYRDFLLKLKPPGWVSLLVLAAPPKTLTSVVQVETAPPYWYVDQSCQSPSGVKGDPAFRLQQLAAGMGDRAHLASVCSDSYLPALKELQARIQAAFK